MENAILDHLTSLAEISGIFLGFTILVSVISPSGYDRLRLVVIVLCACHIFVGALTPTVLLQFSSDVVAVLRASAVILFISNLIGWYLQYSALENFKKVQKEYSVTIPSYLLELGLWIALICVIFNLTKYPYGMYLMAIYFLFIQILVMVVAMVVSRGNA